MRALPVSILSALMLLGACQRAPQPEAGLPAIAVSDGWSRETAAGQETGGGFLTIVNNGEGGDRLIAAASPASAKVELHRMTMDGGVMRMRPVTGGLAVAAGQTVTLEPGGTHMMLIGLKAPLAQGSTIPVTLTFERSGAIDTTLAVRPVGARGPHD